MPSKIRQVRDEYLTHQDAALVRSIVDQKFFDQLQHFARLRDNIAVECSLGHLPCQVDHSIKDGGLRINEQPFRCVSTLFPPLEPPGSMIAARLSTVEELPSTVVAAPLCLSLRELGNAWSTMLPLARCGATPTGIEYTGGLALEKRSRSDLWAMRGRFGLMPDENEKSPATFACYWAFFYQNYLEADTQSV